MTKPDIITVWPTNCDYPLWRQFVRDSRDLFNEIIIAFHNTNQGHDFRQFIQESMRSDYVHFVDNVEIPGSRDWRDVLVNSALLHSYNSEWIWFTEQDFIIKDGFFINVEKLSHEHSVVGFYEGVRLHPACLFMTREVLKNTSRDFSVNPGVWDHFGKIERDIWDMDISKGIIDENTYKHMNGLSHNMSLVYRGEKANYKPDEFIEYMRMSLAVKVPIDSRFVEIANEAIEASCGV